MIRQSLLLGLVLLSFSLAVPANAQIYRGPNSAKQAQKAARRDQKQAAKRQRRAMKAYTKEQRRAAKKHHL